MTEGKPEFKDYGLIIFVLIVGCSIGWHSKSTLSSGNFILDGLQGAFFVSALIVGWRAFLVAKGNFHLSHRTHELNKQRAEAEERISRRKEVRIRLESKISSKVSPVDSFKPLKELGFDCGEIWEALEELANRYYDGDGPERKLMKWRDSLEKVFEGKEIPLETFSDQIKDFQDSKKFKSPK